MNYRLDNEENKEIFVPATYDKCFKQIFANSEAKEPIIELINTFLDIKIDDIEDVYFENTEENGETLQEKKSIYDISLSVKEHTKINIEMQVDNRNTGVHPARTLYYISAIIRKSLDKGLGYNRMPKFISFSILDHNHFENREQYLTKASIREDDDGTLITDRLKFVYLELPKARKYKDIDDEARFWVDFFSLQNKISLEDALQNKELTEGKRVALRGLKNLNNNESVKADYEAELFRKREEEYRIYSIREEGRAEGKAEGELLGRRATIVHFEELLRSGETDLEKILAKLKEDTQELENK